MGGEFPNGATTGPTRPGPIEDSRANPERLPLNFEGGCRLVRRRISGAFHGPNPGSAPGSNALLTRVNRINAPHTISDVQVTHAEVNFWPSWRRAPGRDRRVDDPVLRYGDEVSDSGDLVYADRHGIAHRHGSRLAKSAPIRRRPSVP